MTKLLARISPQAILAGVAIVVVALAIMTRDPLASQLGSWGVGMNLTGFKETSFDRSDSSQESLEAKGGTVTVDIDRSQPTNPTKFISDRQITLNSLYEPTTSPYPEVITNVLNCPTDLKPQPGVSSAGVVYYLPAGDRQNYGVCSGDLVKYQSVYGIFDCRSRGVFEVRIFSRDKTDLGPLIDSFKCEP